MISRISSAVLVGRDRDVDTLSAALDASGTGAPRFVVVLGEAGVGKSRLVREATRPGDGARRLVLTGECLDIGVAGLPYLPIASALRGLARAVPPDDLERLLGPARGDLAAIVPELATDGVAPPVEASASALPSGLGQARLFERILGLFGALSAVGPTVLVVEDVHWIDRATRDLLTFLSRNLTSERLAVVLTCRVDDLPRGHRILAWLAELERVPSTVVLELGRLDRDAVQRQLSLIGGGEPGAGVLDRIWRRSEGNPLLVEELFAAGGSEGPRSVVEVLLARVARLDRPARTIVDAAAIAGRPVDDRLLAEVLEVPEAEIDEGLRAALDDRVLEHEPATGYRFRHELLREVVEAELLPGARRRLHERFARRLEARPELADTSPVGAAAELAHHFAEAGLAVEAYTHLVRAADASEAVHAYADAHRALERALALEPRLPQVADDPGSRLELRRRAADNADLDGEFARALELTREALTLVDPAADPATAGTLHSRVGYLQWSLGDSATALDAHREAVRLVPTEPPTAERARVLASLGGALMGAGRWAESREVCEAAIACAGVAGARAEESRARNMLGSDLVALGDIEGGIAQLREACRLAEETSQAHVRIVGHYNLALNLATADRLDEALEAAEAGRRAVDESGLRRRFGQDLAAITGDVLLRLGRVDDALEVVDAGLTLAPGGSRIVYLSAVRARIAGIRGDTADVERRIGGIDLSTLDPDVAAYVATVRAEALAWADRPDEALAAAEAGVAQLKGLDDVLWTAPLVAHALRCCAELAEAARARRADGALQAAIARTGPFRVQLDRLAPRVTTSSGRAWVASARGELARAGGEADADDWRAAVAAFDGVPDPIDGAYARFRAAEAALRTEGVRADVTALVHEAAAVAEAAGAAPLAAAVATLAARGRIAPRTAEGSASGPATKADEAPLTDPRAAAHALGLSAREVEVLELVAAGLSNGEIAERLFITRKTAGVHVTHILDKLDVPNRVGAAMVAARIGLSGGGEPEDPDAPPRR
ncbi:MAG TPA: AAA family ATPase [Candidatus Limnocylindrales bacterium]|jgi:DNA-binding CsgD family transcriptional regulator/tetratricopeptide (TPR) repeat protein